MRVRVSDIRRLVCEELMREATMAGVRVPWGTKGHVDSMAAKVATAKKKRDAVPRGTTRWNTLDASVKKLERELKVARQRAGSLGESIDVEQELSEIRPGDLIDFDIPSSGVHTLRVSSLGRDGTVHGTVERAPAGEDVGWDAVVDLDDVIVGSKARHYFAKDPQETSPHDGDSRMRRVMP